MLSSRAKRKICSLACALAAGALAACEPPFEPFTDFQAPRVLVHAILDPAADTQRVLIESTNGFENFLGQATVRITTPSGREIALVRPPVLSHPVKYYYRVSDHEPLQPGGTYQLRIEMPGREPITGSTTVPTFDVVERTDQPIRDPFRRDRDTLRLSWPRVPGARGYEVVFSYENRFSGGSFFWSASMFVGDTSVTLAGNARSIDGDDLFRPGQDVKVVVIAVDDNYYTYYRVGADPFAGAPPSRLTGGAIGVFGSVVAILRRSLVVTCEPPNCHEPGQTTP